ncbi:wall-associated receptor kinase-like 8 [Cornus florida]|uniref:wall-associated receptor kinase-like 8 n=1 Tax=Cornus florida TaxID=4283 RepID=UPI0028A09D20|nr:wall-associated receptor kinase-like 8 [Cornus florida]
MSGRKRMPRQLFQLVVHFLISNIITIIYSDSVVVLIFLLLLFLTKGTRSAADSNSHSKQCQEKCGNVSVPYPFGIGKGCYMNPMFEVFCKESTLSYSGFTTLEISVDHYVRIYGPTVVNCYNKSSAKNSSVSHGLDSLPFRVSHTKNKFVAMGCNIFAYMIDGHNKNYISGCASLCYNTTKFIGGGCQTNIPENLSPFDLRIQKINTTEQFWASNESCSGVGCQTNIPENLSPFDLQIQNINATEQFWASHESCSTAFIADNNFSEFNTSVFTDDEFLPAVPLVLDWAIRSNLSCQEASGRKDYACGNNSKCFEDGMGYHRCRCSEGYQGNPYLSDGCQDIDECKDPKKNICPKDAFCFNTAGRYKCKCKPGYHMLAVHVSLGIGIAVGALVFITIGLWLYRKLEKRRKNKLKYKFFRKNGGLLLQQQISSTRESAMKTELFTVEELEKATNNFNESRVLGKGGLGTVYKGMLSDGSIVAVKKSNEVDENQVGQFINEVIILSHINHRNIVKLLGCCLETEVPILVYEYVSNGTLSDHLHDDVYASMSWNDRLRVAGEVAGALAYLHSCVSTTILHRDIKSSNILLDENYMAIVSDFGLSRSVPLNKTHLTTLVAGTFGYLDPEYFRSGQLTDKSDVYSFGVVLAELLTGRKAVSSNSSYEGLVLRFRLSIKESGLFEILDALVVNEGQEEEINVVATLAKRCLKLNAKKRPSMKEVAAELDRLRWIQEQLLIQQNSLNSYNLVENSVDDNSDDDLAFLSMQDSHASNVYPSHRKEQKDRNKGKAMKVFMSKNSTLSDSDSPLNDSNDFSYVTFLDKVPHVMSLFDSDISNNEDNKFHDEQVQEAEKDDEKLKKMFKETIEVKQAINKLAKELIQTKGENANLKKQIDEGKKKSF